MGIFYRVETFSYYHSCKGFNPSGLRVLSIGRIKMQACKITRGWIQRINELMPCMQDHVNCLSSQTTKYWRKSGHHSLYCPTSLAQSQELWLHLLLSSSNASRSVVDWLCHEHSISELPLPAPQMRFLMTVRPKGRAAMHACI